MKKNWIKSAIGSPGALHRDLNVPAGKKIPHAELIAAAHRPGKTGKRARLAITLSHFGH